MNLLEGGSEKAGNTCVMGVKFDGGAQLALVGLYDLPKWLLNKESIIL